MPQDPAPINRLLEIMRALRDPQSGCPWDSAQDFQSIARYALEEAYEAVEAIEQEDYPALRDELGDMLLQIIFHAQIAAERGLFDFDDVATAIGDKMRRRHPHVFGDKPRGDSARVAQDWEAIKAQERAEKQQSGLLADVPHALPALTRAVKLQKRAARVGFEWQEVAPILAKLTEEIAELRAEIAAKPRDKARLEDELGDVFFVLANLARHFGIDPETAIRRSNRKFTRRFGWMETQDDLARLSLSELQTLWRAAKQAGDKD